MKEREAVEEGRPVQGTVGSPPSALSESSPTGEIGSEVVVAARRGDQAAFVAILRHYDHRLRTLASRLLANRDDMDEAMQEAAIKAFRALPGFRGEAALGTWLYRVTYTTCLDCLRRREAAEPVAPDELPDPPSDDHDPAEILDRRESLLVRLRGLPIAQRAAVVLVDEQELDYAAAAAILDIPVGTLASRLAAGRAALRVAYRTPVPSEEAP